MLFLLINFKIICWIKTLKLKLNFLFISVLMSFLFYFYYTILLKKFEVINFLLFIFDLFDNW